MPQSVRSKELDVTEQPQPQTITRKIFNIQVLMYAHSVGNNPSVLAPREFGQAGPACSVGTAGQSWCHLAAAEVGRPQGDRHVLRLLRRCRRHQGKEDSRAFKGPDGFPGAQRGRIGRQCRRRGFEPWPGNNSARVPQPLSLCSGARKRQREKALQRAARTPRQERPAHCGWRAARTARTTQHRRSQESMRVGSMGLPSPRTCERDLT